MINVFILVDQPDIVLQAGYTVVRVYSDTSASGSFSTLLGTVAITADQESVQYLDVLGTESTWYKTSYYGATVGESSKSDAFQGNTTPSYASVLELRGMSNQLGNSEDFEIQMALDAAKGAIDGYTNHPMGFVAGTVATPKLYPSTNPNYLFIDECIEVSLVEVKASPTDTTYAAWDAGTWIACTGEPDYPDYNTQPYDMLIQSGTGIQNSFTGFDPYIWPDDRSDSYGDNVTGKLSRLPNICVTAKWGYSITCPPQVKVATIAQATRWLKRGEAGWADTLASSDFGTPQYRKPLDPDIQMMLVLSRLVKPATGRR